MDRISGFKKSPDKIQALIVKKSNKKAKGFNSPYFGKSLEWPVPNLLFYQRPASFMDSV